MSTRGDTFHILKGHVSVANATSPPVTSLAGAKSNLYKYNPSANAINKFQTQGTPNILAQTFQVSVRSTASPIDMSPLMMLKPRNTEAEGANERLAFGTRKHSTNDRQKNNSMLEQKNAAADSIRTGSNLRAVGRDSLNVSNYRGNLYKQTLQPQWSKSKLREAQKKYEQISQNVRTSFDRNSELKMISSQDTPKQDNSTGKLSQEAWLARTGNGTSPLGGEEASQKLFNKTVTNFTQVKFNNSGGLNPVSPQKRGLTIEHEISGAVDHSNWNKLGDSQIRVARPTLDLDVSETAVSVFEPRKIITDVDQSKRIFKKYSAFQEVDPSFTKTDYSHYLDRVVQDKRHYDTNIGNSLAHQKKFIAYKNREMYQRAAAMHGNSQQDQVHKMVTEQAMLKFQLQKSANVRVQPDQYNYRSPKKYTQISTYYKDLQMNRVFGMDGKMQLLRKNIR